MADDFGLKIGLEGEKEFKKALADINQTFKVLGSEMELVASQFDKQDKSVEALTARNTALNKEIDAQKQKISTLEQALKNAAESFGENDKRTQNWQIQLNKAKAALNGMEKELDTNEKAIREMSEAVENADEPVEELNDALEEAADTVGFLMGVYENGDGPLVYPVLLKDGTYIGYVQAVPFDDGTWEVGYHIGSSYTKKGYATEAVKAFLPVIMPKLNLTKITGICLADNKASAKVMERCGFVKEFEGLGPYQGEERPIRRFSFHL